MTRVGSCVPKAGIGLRSRGVRIILRREEVMRLQTRSQQKYGLGWFAGSLRKLAPDSARKALRGFNPSLASNYQFGQTLVAPWASVFQSIK